MRTIHLSLPVKVLMDVREFDREKTPAPVNPYKPVMTIESLMKDIDTYGIKERLELSIYKGNLLLTDGNHRIIAYKRLGITHCPVKVVFYDTLEELNEAFHPPTVDRIVRGEVIVD